MKLDNDFLKAFNSEPLFEVVVEGLTLFIFDNRMNYLRVPSYMKLTMSAAEELRSTIISFYDGRDVDFCNIIEFESNADIDPNTREWGASRSNEVTAISDAIVINGVAQKMIANFYMKINRPKKPTKFFHNLEGAISWSYEQLEKRTSD